MAVINLIPETTLAGAVTGLEFAPFAFDPKSASTLTVIAEIVRDTGGTTCRVDVSTSFDDGDSWTEIMQFHFTTASDRKLCSIRRATAVAAAVDPDAALADDAILDGLLGGRIKAVLNTTGTYAGTSHITVKGQLA